MVLYKDQMNAVAHEGKEKAVVPLEDFCGLETNLKLDGGEKYVLGIITRRETHCLALPSDEEMLEWADVLREHLGPGEISFDFVYSIIECTRLG